jgi:NAD(P)H-hydrate epimerase
MARSSKPRPRKLDQLAPSDVYVVDRAGLRAIDRLAFEQYGLPNVVLMENAASHLAGAAFDLLETAMCDTALIIAGPGNNGGDGLALARHLHNAQVPVAVALAADESRFTGDAGVHLTCALQMGITCVRIDESHPERTLDVLSQQLAGVGIIVDALFGTGCDRPIIGPTAALMSVINATRQLGVKVLSVDLPSGLDCDTGRGWGPESDRAIRADLTVSFVGLKPGFASLDAQAYLGELMIADIGAPMELVRRFGKPVSLAPATKAGPSRSGSRSRGTGRKPGR